MLNIHDEVEVGRGRWWSAIHSENDSSARFIVNFTLCVQPLLKKIRIENRLKKLVFLFTIFIATLWAHLNLITWFRGYIFLPNRSFTPFDYRIASYHTARDLTSGNLYRHLFIYINSHRLSLWKSTATNNSNKENGQNPDVSIAWHYLKCASESVQPGIWLLHFIIRCC